MIVSVCYWKKKKNWTIHVASGLIFKFIIIMFRYFPDTAANVVVMYMPQKQLLKDIFPATNEQFTVSDEF